MSTVRFKTSESKNGKHYGTNGTVQYGALPIVIDLDIDKLCFEGCQPREACDPRAVADYVDAIKGGVELPPITVFYDAASLKYYCADGHQTTQAHRQLGRKAIKAAVRMGTHRGAVFYSLSANAKHGVRRTRADIRRAVLVMLNDRVWSKWTDKRISEACQCSPTLVRNIRREIGSDAVADEPRVRIAETPDGREKEIVVKGKQNSPKIAEADAQPLLRGVEPMAKTSISPMHKFTKRLDGRGDKYTPNFATPLGPIPVHNETTRTIYWIEGAMTPAAVCEATTRMLILRSLLKDKTYQVVLVGDPTPEAAAFINKSRDLFGIGFERL